MVTRIPFSNEWGKNQRQLAKRADPDGATDTLLQLSLAQNPVAVNSHGSKDCSIVIGLERTAHRLHKYPGESFQKVSPCLGLVCPNGHSQGPTKKSSL